MSSKNPAIALFFRFSKFLLTYRRQYQTAIILSGAVGLLSLINPWLTKLVFDRAIAGKDIKLFIILATVAVFVLILGVSFNVLKSFFDHSLKLKIGADLNRALYAKIQDFPMAWFTERSSSEQVYKLNYDVDRVRDFITSVPVDAVLIFPQTLLTLLIIARLDREIAVLAVFLIPFLYGPYYFLNQKLLKSWTSMVRCHESLFKAQQEVLSHVKLVKVFHQKEHCLQRYAGQLAGNLDIGLKIAALEAKNGFFSQMISKALLVVIGCYGIVRVIHGHMTIGALSAIAVYLAQLMGLQARVFYFFQSIVKGAVSCERLAAVLDQSGMASESPEAIEVSFQSPGIVLKDVSFGYVPDRPVLTKMNFSVPRGACAALVGPSGCGKSTLVGLLTRLYDSWEGEILFDGHPTVKLKRASLMSQMSVALQEPLLWDDTIQNNIRYGREDASDDEVMACARVAGANLFIQQLPSGFATMIGENACRLSEGQKQRIALARALIRRPKILILDEAISALDSESEAAVFSGIRCYCSDTTILYISHRLSMVMKADRVYYLKAPDIIVAGTPSELWAGDKDFVALFGDQKMI